MNLIRDVWCEESLKWGSRKKQNRNHQTIWYQTVHLCIGRTWNMIYKPCVHIRLVIYIQNMLYKNNISHILHTSSFFTQWQIQFLPITISGGTRRLWWDTLVSPAAQVPFTTIRCRFYSVPPEQPQQQSLNENKNILRGSLSHPGIPGVTLCFCTGSYRRRRRRRRRRRPHILVHAITFEQLFGFLSFLPRLLALTYRLTD